MTIVIYSIRVVLLLLSFSVFADESHQSIMDRYQKNPSICMSMDKPEDLYCKYYPDVVKAEAFYKGYHKLKSVVKSTEVNGAIKVLSENFIIASSVQVQGKVTSAPTLLFSWQGNDDSYRFSELSTDKVRIIVDNPEVPWIEFEILHPIKCALGCWVQAFPSTNDIAWIKDATIHVRDSDFKTDIKLQ